MKKFNYLLALFLVLTFSACSDDDEPGRAEQLSKFYWWDDLTLKFNDELVRLQQVKFQTNDLKTAKIDLPALIPGEERILADLTMMPDTLETNRYIFSGSNKNANRELTIKGTVGDSLEVSVSNKVVSELAGEWKLAQTSSVQLDIVPLTEDAKANMFGIMFVNEVPVTGSSSAFDKRTSNIATIVLRMFNLGFNLKESGSFTVNFTPPAGERGELEDKLINYNIVEDKFFVSLSVEKILPGLLGGGKGLELPPDLNIAELLPMILQIANGYQLNTEINDGKLSILINRDMLLPFIDFIIPPLQDLIMNSDFAGMPLLKITKETISQLMGEIGRLVKESKEFNITITLQK